MSYPKNHNLSATQVDRSGESLLHYKHTSDEFQDAMSLVNSWRVAHGYPINTFQASLRKKTAGLEDAIVAQRLKRMPTIIEKLGRYPDMRLSRMQDIGGVRAIVNNVDELRDIEKQYVEGPRITHEITSHKDYITEPKPDGYRGVHIVFKYNNTLARNEIASGYNGLLIEMQLRTRLQHYWATAVETVGIFRAESLKSGQGDKTWLRFFKLSSVAFAVLEKSPLDAEFIGQSAQQIFKQLVEYDDKYKLLEHLSGINYAAKIINDDERFTGYYHLITVSPKNHEVTITSYGRDNLQKASDDYEKRELDATVSGGPMMSVLVSVGKLKTLKAAFPNFFLDIKEFQSKINIIKNEIKGV